MPHPEHAIGSLLPEREGVWSRMTGHMSLNTIVD
jgi:hypothetical protein